MSSGEGLSGRANFGWTLAGRIVYGFCQWAMMSVLTRLGLIEAAGVFGLALSVTSPIMLFTNLHLRNLFATDVRVQFVFGVYQRLRALATAGGMLLCGIVTLVVAGSAEVAVAFMLTGFAKAVEQQLDFRYGIYQRFGRMDRFGQSLVARGALGMFAFAAAIMATRELAFGLVAMSGVWMIILFAADVPHSNAIARVRMREQLEAPPPTWDRIGRLLWLALPLGIVYLVDSVSQNIPRYLVEAYCGQRALGFYAPMSYVIIVGSAFVFALGAPVAPRLARDYNDGDRAGFGRLTLRLVGLAVGLGIGGVVFAILLGETFLRVAYGPAFAEYADVFVWIMLAGGFQFVLMLTLYSLTAARRLQIQAGIYIVVGLATTGLGLAWVPGLGLHGAAYAAIGGMALGAVLAVAAAFDTWFRMPRGVHVGRPTEGA